MSGLLSIFNYYHILKQVPTFENLNWFELQKISSRIKMIEYKKGDIVYQQGSPADGFYCLLTGRLRAYSVDEEGNKCDVEFIHRGMHFGIVSLLTGENHSLSFQAMNDSVCMKIDKKDFEDLLNSIPQLGVELSSSLSRRIRGKAQHAKSIFESTIISVYSPIKDSGSSTYAVNLALSLQKETNKKVILIRIASRGAGQETAAPLSGDEARPPGADPAPQWVSEAVNLQDIVQSYQDIFKNVRRGECPVDLLPVHFDPADTSLVNHISQFVTALVDDYHYLVVDLPNQMDDIVLKTLTQSDVVQLLVLNREDDLEQAREIIDRLKKELHMTFKKEKLHVLLRHGGEPAGVNYEHINRLLGHDVYGQLPAIDPGDLSENICSATLHVVLPGPRTPFALEVRKMAREIGRVLVGLVLGGGAALGLAHIGVLRVLERENVPVDIIVGSSMGALLGSLWVTGKEVDDLENLARQFSKRRNLFKLMDLIFPVSGLIGGKAIERWLRGHLGEKRFYDTRIPFKVVAYDLKKREELTLDSGLLVDAVRRSISIPGVMRPVMDQERVIIDGGVLNPLPTNVLMRMGIKKIIAVNVLQSPEDITRGQEREQLKAEEAAQVSFWQSPLRFVSLRSQMFFTRIFMPNISDIIVNSLMASEYVLAEQSAQQADVVIRPKLIGVNWFELYKVEELINSGEKAAEAALAEIIQLVKE